MSIGDYQKTQSKVETRRAEDYRQLAAITAAMIAAQKDKTNASLWADALLRNQQFWSRLRLYMLEGAPELPSSLRLQCIALAEWVERESAIAANGSRNLDGMLAVNQKIMEGLA